MFNARKVVDSNITLEELVKLNLFMNAYLIFNGMVPGKIEQFVMIVDVQGVSLHEVPIYKFGGMLSRTKTHFAQRMGLGLNINLNWLMKTAVSIIENFLDEF